MSQIEIVALWAGLLSSVVSIVLSVVAIVFTWVVNKRSDQVSDHTIQSLQKIESTVGVLSENTNSLIKGAWEKMLGSVGGDEPAPIHPTKELAAGIASEIRAELTSSTGAAVQMNDERFASLEQSLARLERSIRPARRAPASGEPKVDLFGSLIPLLRALSPTGRELLYAIRARHLTLPQYRALGEDPMLRPAVSELRDSGLLVPYADHDPSNREPVYYLGKELYKMIEPAMSLVPPPPPEVRVAVETALKRVGYDTSVRSSGAS
jgi:hypothetical protein